VRVSLANLFNSKDHLTGPALQLITGPKQPPAALPKQR